MFLLALALAAAPGAQPPASAAALDRGFVCPEALPDDAARTAALGAFMNAASKAAPHESIARLLMLRRSLLEKHHCEVTLRNIDAAEARVRDGEVDAQAWQPLGSASGVTLSISSSYMKPYADPRDPTAYAVETFAKVELAQPAVTNATHTTYDAVVSHNVYYCETGAFALIENDYFLKGRLVLREPEPKQTMGAATVYRVQPISPGSLNQPIARAVCASDPGSTA